MDDMRELISIEAVERLFLAAALGGPLVGLLVGAAVGLRRRAVSRGAARGLLLGALGTANWALWRMYSALTDHFGLDSVLNLLLNLGIFLVLGAAAGLVIGAMMRKRAHAETGGPRPAGGSGGANDTQNPGS
jgi:hypothetical protein